MKRCSVLLIIRRMQIKTSEVSPHTGQHGHHLKSTKKKKNAEEDVEKREEGTHAIGGNVHWLQSLWKTVMEVPSKTKNRTTILSSNPTPEYISREITD